MNTKDLSPAKQILADCLARLGKGESVSLPAVADDAARDDFTSRAELHEQISKMLEELDESLSARSTPYNKSPDTFETDGGQNQLRVRCPQCQCLIGTQSEARLGNLTCGNCGSTFHVVDSKVERHEPRTHIGSFELREQLGAGAFGTVWKAYDASLDRIVALKIPRAHQLDPLEEEQFLREARAAAQLRHPNIVTLYEVGRDQETLFIVSEMVHGENLADWLNEHEISPRQAAEFARDIALALDHAHQAGVIHRDLKPSNIMIDDKNQLHLMDFGLAKRESAEVTVTLDGNILGTPTHMSPELARGQAHSADRRTDIYSAGVILFQCLTGELPFRGNVTMLLNQVLHEEPPSPRKLNHRVPRDLETICLKCMEKEPVGRYTTAAALADDLAAFLEHKPIAARPLGRVAKTWRWCRRNRSIAALLATVMILLSAISSGSIVSTIMVTRQRNEARAERDRNEKFLNYFTDVFRRPDPSIDGRRITVASVLQAAAANARQQLSDDPQTQASMLDAIGHTYLELGLYEDAIDCLEAATEVQQSLRTDEQPDSVRTLHLLGSAYQALGQTAKARSILERVVELEQVQLGLDNSHTLETMTMLAKVLIDEGNQDEAIELLREVWHRHRDRRGEENEKTLLAASNLANVLKDCGQFAEALPLLEDTVTAMRKLHGDEHFQVAAAITNLAGVYRGNGDLEKALPLYEEALRTMTAAVGEQHAATLTIMNNLAGAFRLSGRMDEALVLYTKTYDLRRKILGEKHRATLNSLNSLAVCEDELGHVDKAIELGEQNLRLTQSVLGESHPDTLNVMNNLANALRKAKRTEESVNMHRQTLALRQTTLLENDPEIMLSMHNLAQALFDTGAQGAALELLEDTLKRRQSVLRPGHPDTVETMRLLAEVCRATGNHDRELQLKQELKQLRLVKK